jgi:hypothetical protein
METIAEMAGNAIHRARYLHTANNKWIGDGCAMSI